MTKPGVVFSYLSITVVCQLFFLQTLFSTDLEFVFTCSEKITPYTVIPVFFEKIPDDVRSINVLLEIESEFKQTHFAHYPILKDSENNHFSLIHFLWLLGENSMINKKNGIDKNQYPNKLKISINYDAPLLSYSELLKVEYNPTLQSRNIEQTWTNTKAGNQVLHSDNKKAVIFIHGLHGGTYNNISKVMNSPKVNEWRAEYLEKYWEKYYLFDDVDYYEYQYDTFFHDAEYYGKQLAKLTEKAGIYDIYDQVYLVTYSLGTIVAQFFLNTEMKSSNQLIGENIQYSFMIGSLLEGSYLINLTDYIITNIAPEQSLSVINTCDTKEKEEFLFSTFNKIQSLDGLFTHENVEYLLDNVFEFYRNFPILFCSVLMSFDDIPIFGGQIIPYTGVKSMRYTSESFLEKLETALEFKQNTFISNEKLKKINLNNQFKEKTIIFSTYIEDTEEVLKKTITFASNILNLVDLTKVFGETNNPTNLETRTVPIVVYIAQRLLNKMLSSFAQTIEEFEHMQNDGLVTLWSQNMTPHNLGLNKENMYLLQNYDHENIIDSTTVINTIETIIKKE